MTDVDLSWMNVPGPDGLTFAQRYAQPVDLSWMNVPGPDGLTFIQKFEQGQLTGAQPPVAPPAQPGSTGQQNAFAYVKDQLNAVGLGGMADKVWQFILQNGVEDRNRIQLWIYEQPEFKARFPAFETLQKKYRGVQPAEYIQLERQYAQVMRAAGITSNYFDDPNDFKSLIENDVSQAEFQERVENGFKKVSQADPAVRNAFQRYFGVDGDAALAAFFIDPERSAPKLTKAAQMAEIGGAASTMGVDINLDYAERLTRLGISQQEALAGFRKMQEQRGLFEAGVGEVAIQPSNVSQETIFDAGSKIVPAEGQIPTSDVNKIGTDYIFGTDIGVQRELALRLKQRKAQASGVSQQNLMDKRGKTGIGTAD